MIYQENTSLWLGVYYNLRKENVKAYILSRDILPPMKGYLTVFFKIIAKSFKLDIDLIITSKSTHLPPFICWHADTETLILDAFSIPGNKLKPYIFHLFRFILETCPG